MKRNFARAPESNRHQRPWSDSKRSLMVPVMHSSEGGDLKSGLIRVPARLAHSKVDTNQRHELEGLIRTNLQRWDELMEMNGWKLSSRPRVKGPYEPSVASSSHEADPDEFWYWAIAYFKRVRPLYVPFEDFLETQRLNELFDIDTGKPVLPWSEQGTDETPVEVGWRGAERILKEAGYTVDQLRVDEDNLPASVPDLLKGKTAGIG